MANEIKFIFTGDTAEFDSAINEVVKKANEAKAEMKGQTEQQKAQLKLQKLLAEEYKKAAKTAGSLHDIEKKIKETQAEKVRLSKKLNDSTLDRKKRLETIVQLAKTEAKLSGLSVAGGRRGGSSKGKFLSRAGGVATSAASRAGVGGAASGGMAAGYGAVALGATGPVGIAIGVAVAAVLAPLIISFKTLTAAVDKAKESMALLKCAQISGKTVEQIQAEKAAGLFGGDATQNSALFKELGFIVDNEIIKSLAKTGKVITAFGMQIANLLMPLFEKLGVVLREVIINIGGGIKGLVASLAPVIKHIVDNPILSANPIGLGYALSKMDISAIGPAMDAYRENIEKLLGLGFAAQGGTSSFARLKMSDELTRIGLFKGGRDSQLQTLRASLAAQKETASNTGQPLINAIETA